MIPFETFNFDIKSFSDNMKVCLRRQIIIMTLVVLSANCYGQTLSNYSKKIPPELLKQDFIVLRDSLQSLHAGLYRYKTAPEINAVFDHCYQQLDHPLSETEFFSIVSTLISSIKD